MKNTVIAVLLLISGSLYTAAAQEPSDPAVLLKEAEALFKEASETLQPPLKTQRYLEAAAVYETIIRHHVKNGALYYNLGNAYLRAGAVGKAILNYRRALLYTPWDAQLAHNLDYARKQQKNSFETGGDSRIAHTLLLPFRKVPFPLSSVLAAAASALIWLSLIFRYLGMRIRVPLSVPLLVLALSGAAAAVAAADYLRPSCVITAAQTIGRNGDSTGYEPSFSTPLFEGVECTVLEQRAGWYLVRLDSGDSTWIESTDCEMVR